MVNILTNIIEKYFPIEYFLSIYSWPCVDSQQTTKQYTINKRNIMGYNIFIYALIKCILYILQIKIVFFANLYDLVAENI